MQPLIFAVLISIHAPVKGATAGLLTGDFYPLISIHAPVKGATHSSPGNHLGQTISIHAPVKGATLPCYMDIVQLKISIHAPVKGATCRPAINTVGTRYFNPRSREGSDHWNRPNRQNHHPFQSTLP